MAPTFCRPGVFFLAAAFVLSFITSISLPYLTGLDIARVYFRSPVQSPGASGLDTLDQSRLGIWGYCNYNGVDQVCRRTGYAYSINYRSNNTSVFINSSWTRGLAVHPVATVVILVAFAFSFSTHTKMTLLASLCSFLAALLILIAFAIDIALFAYLKNQAGNLGVSTSTRPGAGFWLTLVVLFLLLSAGCLVCFNRRKERGADARSTPTQGGRKPIWQRWKR